MEKNDLPHTLKDNPKLFHSYSIFTTTDPLIKRGLQTNVNDLPYNLGRPAGWEFVTTQANKKLQKFPKAMHLHKKEELARALHCFANHELLAMELFAWAQIHFFEAQSLKGIWYQTMLEEQSHLNLYIDRIEQLGYSFGDFPLNSFFYATVTKSKTPSEFMALMNLTFEQANLDFAQYYRDIFAGFGDTASANIMQTILEDEILHIRRGIPYMNQKAKESNLSFWDYYLHSLKDTSITPARAKGIHFNKDCRIQANIPMDCITELQNYNDNFAITKRKQWNTCQ